MTILKSENPCWKTTQTIRELTTIDGINYCSEVNEKIKYLEIYLAIKVQNKNVQDCKNKPAKKKKQINHKENNTPSVVKSILIHCWGNSK